MNTLFPITFFHGSTVTAEDVPRLETQLIRVKRIMSDGRYRGLKEIAKLAKPCTEASASARLRDLRKQGLHVESKNLGKGHWVYAVRVN